MFFLSPGFFCLYLSYYLVFLGTIMCYNLFCICSVLVMPTFSSFSLPVVEFSSACKLQLLKKKISMGLACVMLSWVFTTFTCCNRKPTLFVKLIFFFLFLLFLLLLLYFIFSLCTNRIIASSWLNSFKMTLIIFTSFKFYLPWKNLSNIFIWIF